MWNICAQLCQCLSKYAAHTLIKVFKDCHLLQVYFSFAFINVNVVCMYDGRQAFACI